MPADSQESELRADNQQVRQAEAGRDAASPEDLG